jgi:hypothetical protein
VMKANCDKALGLDGLTRDSSKLVWRLSKPQCHLHFFCNKEIGGNRN